MKKFLLLIAAGAVFLLLGFSVSQAQEVIYVAGPPTGTQNLQGLGFSWGDINQDGTLDMFIEPDNLIFNRNNSFTRAPASGVYHIAMVGSILFDFNADGYLDVLTTQGGNTPRLYKYNPVAAMFDSLTPAEAGELATVTSGTGGGQPVWGLAVGDYNRDGYTDIAWAGGVNEGGAGKLRLLKGSATGWVSVGATSTVPVIDTMLMFESWNPQFVDVNNDGYPDLWMPSIRNQWPVRRSVLYLNNGDGTFSPPAKSLYAGPIDTGIVVGDTVRHHTAIGSAWGDFNNDGIMDLMIAGFSSNESAFHLLRGKGDGTFTDVTAASGIAYNSGNRGFSWGDYNNDGNLDLLEAAGWQPPIIWRNNGDGTFTNVRSLLGIPSGGYNSRSGAFIDYNSDGWLDFYACAGGGDALWRNTNGNTNNWIAFRPVGSSNNLSALNAVFTLYTNGGTKKQIRQIEGGSNGGCTNGYLYAHFGVGLATTVDSLVVQWPDGSKQSFTGLAVNKYWTVKEGSSVPAAPMLATPANGATGQPSSLTLTWGPVTGAASYYLQVSLDPEFADPTKLAVDDATLTGASKAVALGDATTYYWRVASVNAGFTSAYSSVYSFATSGSAPATAPMLVSPADADTNQAALIALKCSKVAGASQYHWQVSMSSSFTGFTVDDYTVDTVRTAQLVSGRKYYWRVAGVNGAGASAFSTVQSFTVMTAPGTPALVYPANNEQNVRADTLTLTWRAAARASHYVFQMARSASSFQLVVVENTTTDTTLQVVGLQRQTTYYWRVRAYNDGGTSLFTSGNSFVTVIAAPAVPVASKPAANATEVNRQTTFTWSLSVNAVKYRLQVALDNAFATVVRDVIIYEDSTHTLEVPLDETSDYFWHVSAGNIGGWSAYTSPRYFSTGTQMTVKEDAGVPGEFALIQNFPNPFNPSTTIPYEVPKTAHVKIVIYDLLGREVATLVDGVLAANRYSVEWRASALGSGVYFYRMEARSQDGSGDFNSVKKLLFMK